MKVLVFKPIHQEIPIFEFCLCGFQEFVKGSLRGYLAEVRESVQSTMHGHTHTIHTCTDREGEGEREREIDR